MYEVSARFLDVVAGSHRAVVRVQVLPTTESLFPQFGATPAGGTELPLLDGDIKLTSTADVNGSVDISVSGDYWDVLQPYGAELFVERGVDFGDGTRELVPCGYYGIEEVSQSSAPAGPVQVSAFDRLKRLKRNRVLYPMEFAAGTTHRVIFEALVNGQLPSGESPNNYGMFLTGSVPVAFTGYDPDIAKIGTSLMCEDDPQEFLGKIADARGCVLRFTRTGELEVAPRNLPPGATPVYSVGPGATGNLISTSRKVTRDGIYNMIVARGSDPANPTGYRLAYNTEPDSPLKWDGPLGVVTRYYASPLLLTNESADIAAESVLSRYKGLPSSLSMMAVPNPALDPLDVVQAQIGNSVATHLIDQVSIPLAGSQPVEIITRTLNEIPSVEEPTGGGGFPNPSDPGAGGGGTPGGGGGTPGGGTGGGTTGNTAAEVFGWGTPLPSSDDFALGIVDSAKWSVYNGPGHDGNGRRLPARVAVINGILTLTGLANGDSAGMEHRFDQQYGRWEIRARSFPTATGGGGTGGGGTGGGGTPPAGTQTLGVGGVATPPGAILATSDQPGTTLNITTSGTASSPRVYDGQGHRIGQIKIRASYVTVQNYHIESQQQYGIDCKLGTSNHDVIIQNNDIKDLRPSGDGDLNCFTINGNNITIAYNTAINFVGQASSGSHTDFIQTWNDGPGDESTSNLRVIGNRAEGVPADNGDKNHIHQALIGEGKDSTDGGGGGTGVSQNWFVADNYWTADCKFDDIDNVTYTRNTFAGVDKRAVVVTSLSSGFKYYSDNKITGTTTVEIGASVIPGPGPATPTW